MMLYPVVKHDTGRYIEVELRLGDHHLEVTLDQFGDYTLFRSYTAEGDEATRSHFPITTGNLKRQED